MRPYTSLLGAISARMTQVNVGLVSAGVAFYGLLAVFPSLTAIVALWSLFADPAVVTEEARVLEPMLPDEGFDILESQIEALASGATTTLGWASAVSLAGALWASRLGVTAMIGALNKVHQCEPRGGVLNVLTALALSAGLILSALVALGAVVIAPVLLSVLPVGNYVAPVLEVTRWVIGVGIVLMAVGALYRLGPAAKQTRPRWRRMGLITPGVLVAVAMWAIVSWGFSTYLANFGNYDRVYGSLGAVIALLMWMYFSAFVVLLGAIFDVEFALAGRADAPVSEDEAGATASDEPPAAGPSPNVDGPA